jgi:ribosome biogenesis GTPase
MKGLVIKSTGSWYEVKADNGDILKVRLKGIFRLDETKDTNPIAVGDKVLVSSEDADNSWVVDKIEERENYIVRSSPKHKGARQVIAANLDQAVLVVTMANPRTSTGFIDRFLITAEANHIPTIIVFNKQDLLDPKTRKKQEYVSEIYKNIGYQVLFVSSVTGENIDDLKSILKNKTTLVSGHSGVGKSTLMNAVQPGLNLRTNDISKFSGKGMHTTTFAEMHFLNFGGSIIDTPGIREFGIMDFKPEEISHYFVEMREALKDCKFNNCIHENEPGCGVRKAYEARKISEDRYGNYLNIMIDYKANYKHWE